MIPVQLTCEAHELEPGQRTDEQRYEPVVALNGDVVWRGRPEPSAPDAERVALAYLRYALGGVLGAPGASEGPPPPREEPPPSGGSAEGVAEALDALGQEVRGALKRAGEFLERGDWRRFLG
jgi:hypothetical protein